MVTQQNTANTFAKLLLKHAKERHTQAAMREKDLGIWQTITWAEMAEEVKNLAHGFMTLGVQKGQHVAIVGENRPRLYMSMMAAQSLGAIPVPMYQDAVAQEMVYVLKDAEVSVVVVEDQEQADKMLEVLDHLPILRHVIYDDPRGMRNYNEDLLMDYADLIEQGKAHCQKNPDLYMQNVESLRADEPAAMFYTSGTTGNPKGVVLTHHALIDRAEVIQRLENLTDKEDVLAYLPPAWIVKTCSLIPSS